MISLFNYYTINRQDSNKSRHICTLMVVVAGQDYCRPYSWCCRNDMVLVESQTTIFIKGTYIIRGTCIQYYWYSRIKITTPYHLPNALPWIINWNLNNRKIKYYVYFAVYDKELPYKWLFIVTRLSQSPYKPPTRGSCALCLFIFSRT